MKSNFCFTVSELRWNNWVKLKQEVPVSEQRVDRTPQETKLCKTQMWEVRHTCSGRSGWLICSSQVDKPDELTRAMKVEVSPSDCTENMSVQRSVHSYIRWSETPVWVDWILNIEYSVSAADRHELLLLLLLDFKFLRGDIGKKKRNRKTETEQVKNNFSGGAAWWQWVRWKWRSDLKKQEKQKQTGRKRDGKKEWDERGKTKVF